MGIKVTSQVRAQLAWYRILPLPVYDGRVGCDGEPVGGAGLRVAQDVPRDLQPARREKGTN